MNNQSKKDQTRTPGFVFYQSYYEALSQLKARQRHAILDAILEYAFTGVKPELSGTSSAILAVILPNVSSCQKRFRGASERAAKKAGEVAENQDDSSCVSKAQNEDMSTIAKTAESSKKPSIEKEKEKEKENEMDKGVYKEKEKESAAAPETPCGDRAAPDGNTNTPQRESCIKIISDYAGSDSELQSLLESWIDIKKQRNQPITAESIRLNLEELTRITEGSDKKAYMKEVVRRGWGTFFELEKNPRQSVGRGSGGNSSEHTKSKQLGLCESSFDIEEFDRFTLGV